MEDLKAKSTLNVNHVVLGEGPGCRDHVFFQMIKQGGIRDLALYKLWFLQNDLGRIPAQQALTVNLPEHVSVCNHPAANSMKLVCNIAFTHETQDSTEPKGSFIYISQFTARGRTYLSTNT